MLSFTTGASWTTSPSRMADASWTEPRFTSLFLSASRPGCASEPVLASTTRFVHPLSLPSHKTTAAGLSTFTQAPIHTKETAQEKAARLRIMSPYS